MAERIMFTLSFIALWNSSSPEQRTITELRKDISIPETRHLEDSEYKSWTWPSILFLIGFLTVSYFHHFVSHAVLVLIYSNWFWEKFLQEFLQLSFEHMKREHSFSPTNYWGRDREPQTGGLWFHPAHLRTQIGSRSGSYEHNLTWVSLIIPELHWNADLYSWETGMRSTVEFCKGKKQNLNSVVVGPSPCLAVILGKSCKFSRQSFPFGKQQIEYKYVLPGQWTFQGQFDFYAKSSNFKYSISFFFYCISSRKGIGQDLFRTDKALFHFFCSSDLPNYDSQKIKKWKKVSFQSMLFFIF